MFTNKNHTSTDCTIQPQSPASRGYVGQEVKLKLFEKPSKLQSKLTLSGQIGVSLVLLYSQCRFNSLFCCNF